MITNIPPPPPLAASLLVKPKDNTLTSKLNTNTHSNAQQNRWTEECKQVIKNVLKKPYEDGTSSTEQILFYTQNFEVPSVVQDGPQCGLVALCMAAEMLGQTVNIEDVVEAAKKKGYTKKGEMFSVTDTLNLAQSLLGCDGKIVKSEQRKEYILQNLKARCPVLMPYDRDHNNEPCTRSGKKAHWATLTGFLLKTTEPVDCIPVNEVSKDEKFNNLFILSSKCDCPESLYRQMQSSNIKDIYVYAKQGKSPRTHLWSLEDLLTSNSQLAELSSKITENISDYVIPTGGMTEGLNNQIVVLYNK